MPSLSFFLYFWFVQKSGIKLLFPLKLSGLLTQVAPEATKFFPGVMFVCLQLMMFSSSPEERWNSLVAVGNQSQYDPFQRSHWHDQPFSMPAENRDVVIMLYLPHLIFTMRCEFYSQKIWLGKGLSLWLLDCIKPRCKISVFLLQFPVYMEPESIWQI